MAFTFNETVKGSAQFNEGTVVLVEGSVEKALAEHDITMDDVKKYQKAINSVTVDLAAEIGRTAVDALAADSKLEEVSGEFTIGKQKTKVLTKREAQVKVNVADPSQGTRPVKGYTTVSTSSTISSTASRNARHAIQDYATNLLK